MGLKVKRFPSLLPSCNQLKTLSFRAKDHQQDIFKTLNSVYFDINRVETPKSWFTEASEPVSFSTELEVAQGAGELGESVEAIIRGVQSQSSRLFFKPGGETSSILDQEAAANTNIPFESSVVLAMESDDPYEDFRRSMEEMVEIHGLMRDWRCLEELLSWYLRVNGKMNHGYIVDAFVDLLVGVASNSPRENNTTTCSSSSRRSSIYSEAKSATSFSSAASSFSSSFDQNEICYKKDGEKYKP